MEKKTEGVETEPPFDRPLKKSSQQQHTSLDADVLTDPRFATWFLCRCIDLLPIQDYQNMLKVCRRWQALLAPPFATVEQLGHRDNIVPFSVGHSHEWYQNCPASLQWAPLAALFQARSVSIFCRQFCAPETTSDRWDMFRHQSSTPFAGGHAFNFDCRSMVYDSQFVLPAAVTHDREEVKDDDMAFVAPRPLGRLTWVVTWKEVQQSAMYHRLARFLLLARHLHGRPCHTLLKHWLQFRWSHTDRDTQHGDVNIKASHEYLMAIELWSPLKEESSAPSESAANDDVVSLVSADEWSMLRHVTSHGTLSSPTANNSIDHDGSGGRWPEFESFVLWYLAVSSQTTRLVYAYFFWHSVQSLRRGHVWALDWASDDEWHRSENS